jgi:hypothetical protein
MEQLIQVVVEVEELVCPNPAASGAGGSGIVIIRYKFQ